MGKLRTSAAFYYRGVPTTATNFGGIALGNYSIVKPMLPSINTGNFLYHFRFSNYNFVKK